MINNRKLIIRWLIGLGIAALFFFLIWRLKSLATLILLSFLVSYVLNPLVERLDRLKFINRVSATIIVLTGLTFIVLVGFFVIIPDVWAEVVNFIARLPDLKTRAETELLPRLQALLGPNAPVTLGGAWESLSTHAKGHMSEVIGPATAVAASLFGGTFSVVFFFISLLLFPLFVFFLLANYPAIVASMDDLVPVIHRSLVHKMVGEIDTGVSAFLHGQFTVMLVLATLYSVGYAIVGIPVAIGVGLMTGVLCFIPYVGAATGFLIALLLAALEFSGVGKIIGVMVVFGTVQLLDGVLITPRIMGGKLGLSPLWIILALMAGGELFGFLGVLLAVPTIAVLKVVVHHSLEHYRKTSFYSGRPTILPPDPYSVADETPDSTTR
ncbi:MAG: AI-2E family transporter [Myxococcota bacterium]|jgi:predicted PurR-regulated permease PerM|nr:AI-2E family transporter [Myxococcota bacterium]